MNMEIYGNKLDVTSSIQSKITQKATYNTSQTQNTSKTKTSKILKYD